MLEVFSECAAVTWHKIFWTLALRCSHIPVPFIPHDKNPNINGCYGHARFLRNSAATWRAKPPACWGLFFEFWSSIREAIECFRPRLVGSIWTHRRQYIWQHICPGIYHMLPIVWWHMLLIYIYTNTCHPFVELRVNGKNWVPLVEYPSCSLNIPLLLCCPIISTIHTIVG